MKTVETSLGPLQLRKPTAGERNRALQAAETKGGEIRLVTFMVEILPVMVMTHPFGAKPIVKALDDLSIEDYDLILDAAKDIFQFNVVGDAAKKLSEPSPPE
jgi:hypothetical protein